MYFVVINKLCQQLVYKTVDKKFVGFKWDLPDIYEIAGRVSSEISLTDYLEIYKHICRVDSLQEKSVRQELRDTAEEVDRVYYFLQMLRVMVMLL